MTSQNSVQKRQPGQRGNFSKYWLPQNIVRIALILGITLLGIQIVLLFLVSSDRQKAFINNLFFSLTAFLSIVILGYGAYCSRRISVRLSWVWGIVAAGALSTATGAIIHFIQASILGQTDWSSISDFFYLIANPFFLVAALIFFIRRITFGEIVHLGLDVGIIMTSSVFIIWKLVIDPILSAGGSNPTAIFVALAYPLGDLLLICAVVMIIMRPDPLQPPQPVWIMLGAIVFTISGDLLAAGPQSAAVDSDSNWLNIFFSTCALVMMIAGALQASHASGQRHLAQPFESSRASNAIRLILPYPWLGGAYAVLATLPASQLARDHDLVFWWMAFIISLVLVRQFLALLENQRLTLDLAILNQDLEKRVIERTTELNQANEELREEMVERERVESVLREREERLAFNALHDALTGLPNRILLMERIDQAIRRLRRQEEANFVLLFLDFDGFKVVNDSLGHLSGDQVLVQISRRMRAIVREVDMVARMGGDEFVILMEDISSLESAKQVTERLIEKIAEPYEINGQQVFLTASVGLVPGDGKYQQPTDLLRDADLAMYEAKARGKACYVVFSPELRVQALDRLLLESNLRSALERNEFILHYQPILDLNTNQLTGFEALIRWQHPEKGLIPPANFIPVAEASGIILPITRWVMREACTQMNAWHTELPRGNSLMISINLSPKLFSQPELPRMVAEVLAETGLESKHLILEITEGVIVEDSDAVRGILETWRQQGIQVHMDDFGTGYSSLSYLHRLPIDTLKIDRTFIKQIRKNGDRGEIVRTIITLAREINVPVIAEGIETAEQLSFLKKLGCQSGQGFLISQPVEAGQAKDLIIRQWDGNALG
ncbi:MAG TPA: EAL domain-containing protein [Anaerolineaceae bacterium]|nr:EAL domain-containing protein [Anaerolineaceae bacterium]